MEVKNKTQWIAWSIFSLLFLVHVGYVFFFAVEMPILDEVAFVDLWHNSTAPNLDYLLFQHSDSRAIFTRIFGWISLHLTGYNFYFDIVLNFALLLCFLFCFLSINKTYKIVSTATLVFFSLFLLSPISSQIHYSRICNQWRFFEIFAILAATFLFKKSNKTNTNLVIGTLFAICSLYSFIAGLVASLTLMALKTLLIFADRRQYTSANIKTWIGCLGLFVGSIWFYFIGYAFANGSISMPWSWTFWNHYLNLISMGFNGMEEVSAFIGFLDLLIIVVPIFILFRRNWRDPKFQVLTAITLCLLGSLALISLGRSIDGPEFAKIYRYAETGILLVIPTIMLWAIVLSHTSWTRRIFISFFVYLFVFFLNDWDFHVYNHIALRTQRAQDCLFSHYINKTDGMCPDLGPQPSVQYILETGERLNLAYFRRFMRRMNENSSQ